MGSQFQGREAGVFGCSGSAQGRRQELSRGGVRLRDRRPIDPIDGQVPRREKARVRMRYRSVARADRTAIRSESRDEREQWQ